ncbi:dihydrofolate reductase family protein [Arthrobacter citreus]|uniref:Dihydrofolate reductase family protein n=1 Tax=Arthrobacter citreus TaxID=1670 RepID=A0ABZ3A1Q9_9MICC
MTRIIYSVASSLDGYNSDPSGDFSWAFPDEAVVAALTADAESVGTYLMGRRMYETMAIWETDPSAAEESPESEKFAQIWQRTEKVVFSSTLDDVWTARTRLEPAFTLEAVERATAEGCGDITVEGRTLAASALRLGVVDVVELLVCPAVVGGGTRVFPDGLSLNLRLVRERRFDNGMVQVTYDVQR